MHKCFRKLKFFLAFLFALSFYFPIYSQVHGSQQLIQAGHWTYDALYMLLSECGMSSLACVAPITVSEFKMYFEKIPYEKLSYSGQKLYGELLDFFDGAFQIKFGAFRFGFNIELNPSLMYKSNKNLDWSFATDYTGHITKGDFTYGAGSNFYGNDIAKDLAIFPLYFSFADIVFFETDILYAKNFLGMEENQNFTNFPYKFAHNEFFFPKVAYGSIGKTFKNWGINFNISRTGLQIGRTQTGSIIYNNTFQTDAYVQFNVFSQYIKYNLDIAQVQSNRYVYLHNLELAPFKWIKFGLTEGTLVSGAFELRFLNPLMFMHQFGAWNDYGEGKHWLYSDQNFCAYIGVSFDIIPSKYVRIYGLYAQNEIQSFVELNDGDYGRTFPDSLGGQLGIELTFPEKSGGYFLASTEAIYTTPFLYLKQARENSLVAWNTGYYSWIGTPFGPDCVGLHFKFKYTRPRKWNVGSEYLFVAHGTNSFGLFGNTMMAGENEVYCYYPTVLYRLLNWGYITGMTVDDITRFARSYALTGTIQFTNAISLKGEYHFNDYISISSTFAYLFVFNNKNVSNSFEQGVQLSFMCSVNLL